LYLTTPNQVSSEKHDRMENMKAKTLLRFTPIVWGIIIFVLAQGITLLVASHEDAFLTKHNLSLPVQSPNIVSIWPVQTTSPSGQVTQTPAVSSLGPILIYFFAVIIILAIILFSVPLSALKSIFRVIFAFLYCWSIFVISYIWLPFAACVPLAVLIGVFWFFNPRIWLHNIVMLLAMVALGEVFGRLISPWTAMILLAVLAVYDFLAVRFGFMLWMADKLSSSNTLPAFLIPYRTSDWVTNLKKSDVPSLTQQKVEERKYSILGGGDIGFPVLLASAVYFSRGFLDGITVAAFSLLGLLGAYLIQARFQKGKAVPALPPIAVLSVIGLALVSFVF
jgi:presenilin-like A22 family membrane protease